MRKLIVALALWAILIPNNGFALGLGEIEVNSALNQKLSARIDLLSAAPEDAETLIIKLASREEFVRAGLDRPVVLTSLTFKTSVDGKQVYIDVLSAKPIREPFLNFLVEVDWPQGHLIREYTILLDPPVFMGGQQKPDPVSDRAAMQEPARRAPTNNAQPSVEDGFRPAADDFRPGVDSFRPAEDDFRPTSQSSSSVKPVVTTPVARETIKSAPIQQQERYSEPENTDSTPRYTAPTPSYTAPTPRYIAPTPSYAPPAGRRIQKGDTAWSIANRTKPDSVSTQQMLIAMLRSNPDVFIDGNVNGLKKGFILRAPDMATINAVNHEEAISAVRQQNALWREYQQSLSTDKPASAIAENITETESSSAVDGMNDKSRLSIVSAGSGSSASGEMDASVKSANKLREQLALAREQVETERVEKETLQQQVDSLSTQVEKMKGLLVIEDKAMAEIQSAGDLPAGDLPEEKALVADDVSEEMVVEDAVAEPSKSIEQQAFDALDALVGLFKDEPVASEESLEVEPAAEEVLEVESAAEEVLEIDPAAEEVLELEQSADQLFLEETAVTAEQAADAEMLTEQEMLNEMELADAAQHEASLVETLLNNRMVLGGLLVVLLVIGAIVYLLKRRRNNASGTSSELKKNEETGLEDDFNLLDDAFMDDLVSDADLEVARAESGAESGAEAAGAESGSESEEFDADATMILPSAADTIVTPVANLQPEEEEQDDVLAEADVYLAYGIYQQAEELLENAIKANPDKDSYRVKLAETYFAGKNAEAFVKLGAEMKQRLGNEESPAWIKVATMGKELCPDEAIFQQSGLDAGLDINDLMPKSPEPMDLELGGDDGVSELDLDFDSPLDETTDDTGFELPSIDETVVMSPVEPESVDELEFDLSETDALEESPVEEEFSLDMDASELDLGLDSAGDDLEAELDMDLDMGLDMSMDSEPEAVSESADDGMDFDLDMSTGDDSFDLSAGDGELDMSTGDDSFDLPAGDDELDMSTGDGSFDLSAGDDELDMSAGDDELDMSAGDDSLDMSLDDDGEIDLTDEASDLGLSTDDDLGGMDLSEPLDAEEVNTKLDLSKAYLDMGDHEGARDILQEVIAGGNAEQKKEAEELMAQAI